MIGSTAIDYLRDAPIGTRVVVRYALPAGAEAGATDALGELSARTAESCTVETRRGAVTVVFATVIAAKPVPPAPEPRNRRRPV